MHEIRLTFILSQKTHHYNKLHAVQYFISLSYFVISVGTVMRKDVHDVLRLTFILSQKPHHKNITVVFHITLLFRDLR